jgi:hypothetical protein
VDRNARFCRWKDGRVMVKKRRNVNPPLPHGSGSFLTRGRGGASTLFPFPGWTPAPHIAYPGDPWKRFKAGDQRIVFLRVGLLVLKPGLCGLLSQAFSGATLVPGFPGLPHPILFPA